MARRAGGDQAVSYRTMSHLLALLALACSEPAPTISAEPQGGADGHDVGAGGVFSTGSAGQGVSGETGSGGAPGAGGGSSGPTVVVAQCDKVGPGGMRYAEATFPGRTADSLAGVVAIQEWSTADGGVASRILPPGYSESVAGAAVRDGAVGMVCAGSVVAVRFVVPTPP